LQKHIHQTMNVPGSRGSVCAQIGTLNVTAWYLLKAISVSGGVPRRRRRAATQIVQPAGAGADCWLGLVAMAEPSHPGMGDAGQMWEQAFPGAVKQAGQVRAALRPVLGDCPVADEAVLLLSELSANAVAHSASGSPGGKFTVRLQHVPGQYVRGEVEDEGSGWDGSLRDSARDASGLLLVIKLASACGVDCGADGHRLVWFRIDYAAGDHSGAGPGAVIGTTIDKAGGPAPARRPRPGYRSQPAMTTRPGMVLSGAAHASSAVRLGAEPGGLRHV
jgi:hypothetical protein